MGEKTPRVSAWPSSSASAVLAPVSQLVETWVLVPQRALTPVGAVVFSLCSSDVWSMASSLNNLLLSLLQPHRGPRPS